jgi:hypothetical protein
VNEMGFWDWLFEKLRTQEEERQIDGYYDKAKKLYGVEEE